MKKIASIVSMILITILPKALMAHPGHGGHDDSGYTITHYLFEPMHSVVTISCIVFAVAVLLYTRKKEKSK
jgi:hypothetical protein